MELRLWFEGGRKYMNIQVLQTIAYGHFLQAASLEAKCLVNHHCESITLHLCSIGTFQTHFLDAMGWFLNNFTPNPWIHPQSLEGFLILFPQISWHVPISAGIEAKCSWRTLPLALLAPGARNHPQRDASHGADCLRLAGHFRDLRGVWEAVSIEVGRRWGKHLIKSGDLGIEWDKLGYKDHGRI